jgi:hypothetical protein
MSKRLKCNTKDLAKGDKFQVTTAIELTDAGVAPPGGGPKLTDCTLIHNVTKNGENFVDSSTTWFGLADTGVAAIQDSIRKGGLTAGTKSITGFKALVAEWRTLTAVMAHLNDAGDEAVKLQSLD